MEFGYVLSAQENTEAWEFTSGQPFKQAMGWVGYLRVHYGCKQNVLPQKDIKCVSSNISLPVLLCVFLQSE